LSLPIVSIIIPSYKPEHFEQSLRSALGQTYQNIEICVSDNCPTDAIRAICARYPMVIYQRNVATREQNVLTSMYGAKGHYIKPLFDDDLLHPFCVQRMVASAEGIADTAFVFSASSTIDADNRRVQERRPFRETGTLDGASLQRMLTLGMVNFVGEFSSIMIRRDALWRVAPQKLFWLGDHDCSLGLADMAAYCNLAAGGKAVYLDEELSYFRRDPNLTSNSNASTNPNFGYCYSDYFDMLIQSHRLDNISTDELLGTRARVADMAERVGPVYPQVGDAWVRFSDYTDRLSGPR
jgi:glycosyltransferase involved in cell wall biosynthesis